MDYIKDFILSPYTVELRCENILNSDLHKIVQYTMSNGASIMKIVDEMYIGQEERNNMKIYTKPSEKSLEIRSNENIDFVLYMEITYLKDIKEVLNLIKMKFIPHI